MWILAWALSAALAQPPDDLAKAFVGLEADQAQWRSIEGLPKGAEYVQLRLDPETKASELLIRLPRRFEVPPHRHTHRETIVVIEGRLHLAALGQERSFGPGSYVVNPGGLLHGTRTSRWKGCVFYARVDGPFDLLFESRSSNSPIEIGTSGLPPR